MKSLNDFICHGFAAFLLQMAVHFTQGGNQPVYKLEAVDPVNSLLPIAYF